MLNDASKRFETRRAAVFYIITLYNNATLPHKLPIITAVTRNNNDAVYRKAYNNAKVR